jgi:outer membrane protein
LDRVQKLLKETQIMYHNGFVEKIDVDRLEVQYNNLKVERDKVGRLIILSVQLLKYQMGMPINEPLVVVGDLRTITLNYETEKDGFEYEKRVEYSQMQTNRELTLLDLKNNRMGYLPRLSAYAGVGANTGVQSFGNMWNFSDRWFANSAVGVRLSVPVFDGMYKSYRIQRNKIQLQQIDNQLKELENVINLQLEQSDISLRNSYENMITQEKNMKLAEDVARVASIKYEQGVGSSIEVLNAETSLKEAQTNYYAALYDALISKVDLDKARGNLLVK